MKYHVLLLEDVTNHGRKGEIVYVAPGFARNHLLPKGKAFLASFATVKLQEKLQKERAKQAKGDLVAAEKLAASMRGKELSTIVKVDSDGHMYGSVSITDIVDLLFNEGIEITKKQVALHMPIKSLGKHQISLKLPEEVSVTISLEVKPDKVIKKKKEEKPAEVPVSEENAEKSIEESTEVKETESE